MKQKIFIKEEKGLLDSPEVKKPDALRFATVDAYDNVDFDGASFEDALEAYNLWLSTKTEIPQQHLDLFTDRQVIEVEEGRFSVGGQWFQFFCDHCSNLVNSPVNERCDGTKENKCQAIIVPIEKRTYMSREYSLKSMGFEIDGETMQPIVLPENKTFEVAIPTEHKEAIGEVEHFVWKQQKPEWFNEECLLLTASRWKEDKPYNYTLFEIRKLDSGEGMYWGVVCPDGEEWGDYGDLSAKLYMTMPLVEASLKMKQKTNNM